MFQQCLSFRVEGACLWVGSDPAHCIDTELASLIPLSHFFYVQSDDAVHEIATGSEMNPLQAAAGRDAMHRYAADITCLPG